MNEHALKESARVALSALREARRFDTSRWSSWDWSRRVGMGRRTFLRAVQLLEGAGFVTIDRRGRNHKYRLP